MNEFGRLLETICFLGGKERSKEETLTYLELLRYTGSLARLNAKAVECEIARMDKAYLGRA